MATLVNGPRLSSLCIYNPELGTKEGTVSDIHVCSYVAHCTVLIYFNSVRNTWLIGTPKDTVLLP